MGQLDREVRHVVGELGTLTSDTQETRQHLSTLRDSVVNLEIGQSRSEVMMEMLVGAHNISPESLRERMEFARERLAVSQKNRGLLPPAGCVDCLLPHGRGQSSQRQQKFTTTMAGAQSPNQTTGTSTGIKRPTPEVTRPTPVNLLVDDAYKRPLHDLPVAVLQKMLVEMKGAEALECLKYRNHCDVVGAISHNMQDGLYLVLKVIKTPLSKQIWTVECGRVCYVSPKGALSWGLNIPASSFTAGRGWSQNIGQAPRYDVAMNHVFCYPHSAQARAENPPSKQIKVDLAAPQHSGKRYVTGQQSDPRF